MANKIRRKMSQLCKRIVEVDIRWGVLQRVSFVGQFFHFIWDRLLVCSVGKKSKSSRYTRLPLGDSSLAVAVSDDHDQGFHHTLVSESGYETDSDLVNLKISLLGDCHIGKTTFVIKYVGNEQEKKGLQMEGLNLMDKTLFVQGARISFSIWDVSGDKKSLDQIPMACKDADAVLIMFDLTSRCTLNGVFGWYSEARKWNQAPPRFTMDNCHTVQLIQARAYARAMKATLFFSSATHNINVNKIFKFIMAKLFNLPWTVERNVTVGEPIIDFY
ncbi:septum-promoting GTP-binding protein 1-like isoform X2 [Arachis stenosperma]|uniref:septum-promoting GTP-binding protein 1-like isoform X2 n=1 Tax=Arachis stenosperma TaxID=217475 RepID=UPI0025AB607F|nr:septum-promoting GTP-binding protein 1-like isoform X2 [Arachis stenosperma]